MGGGAVNWSSKLQSVQALSSGEAEYIGSANAGQEISWTRNLLSQLGFTQILPTTLHLDNNSAINWNENPSGHNRTKHIDLKYHYTRNLVARKEVKVQYCPTSGMTADILTKPLGSILHNQGMVSLGLVSRSSGSVGTS
jgi:hypothetical protein